MTDIDILQDELTHLQERGPLFVTFGEGLIRDTPADGQRLERTRQVTVSAVGSELNTAVGVSRLGIPSAYVTRVPRNPFGRLLRNTVREQGVNARHIVWAPETEPIGRYLYEIGQAPRQHTAIYQRQYSAASRLGRGMVDWQTLLHDARLLHLTGITFGLSTHSGYEQNYCLEALLEAVTHLPADAHIGLDFNYRSTLWSLEEARQVLTPLIEDHVSVLITSIYDMAGFYGMGCGGHSAKEVLAGAIKRPTSDALLELGQTVIKRFDLKMVAFPLRYADSFERHRWESAVVTADDNIYRSQSIQSFTIRDRLGGGDAWSAGFYYGLLVDGFTPGGIQKGVAVGDAMTRLKHTLMYDLPIITREEVQALIDTGAAGGRRQVIR